jgi:hypothetical protein
VIRTPSNEAFACTTCLTSPVRTSSHTSQLSRPPRLWHGPEEPTVRLRLTDVVFLRYCNWARWQPRIPLLPMERVAVKRCYATDAPHERPERASTQSSEETRMDVKAIAGSLRSGRRNALAGLLAGAAALLGQSIDTEAGRRRCPRCPNRSCCVCNSNSETPGCRFAPAPTASTSLLIRCETACGGAGTADIATYSPPTAGEVQACRAGGASCVAVDCPLY